MLSRQIFGLERPESPSERLLSRILNKLIHLDLSDDVTVDNRSVPAQGGYADVYIGQSRRYGRKVAVKRLRLHVGGNWDVVKNFAKEIRIWSELNHKNVLPLLGYMIEGNYMSLVSEWMERGSLRSCMPKLSTRDLFIMSIGIADGLAYLHSRNVIHSDLKTDNVLVSLDGTPLLTDFGVSRLESSSTTGYNTETVRGSTRWLSFEFFEISDDDLPPPTHNEKTDVWSLGMTILELITGDVPYASIKNDLRVMFTIVKGLLPSEPTYTGSPSDISLKRYMWSICQVCWTKNPAQRPSAATILGKMERYRRDNFAVSSYRYELRSSSSNSLPAKPVTRCLVLDHTATFL
ncbi:kinase-like protein [Schizopora paradoxa]|uniref:Kinase-like protein n=1 Tax=Schizopora paradoxa TaxID=27342 RepID=A0A0H2R5Q6_9AGAM|nr:kinase-like protein [Schizopora paradoxa]